jgi:hypothetical protein
MYCAFTTDWFREFWWLGVLRSGADDEFGEVAVVVFWKVKVMSLERMKN